MTGKSTLPVPAQNLFEISERHSKPIKALLQLPHHAQRDLDSAATARQIAVDAGSARRMIPGSAPLTPPGLRPGPVMAR